MNRRDEFAMHAMGALLGDAEMRATTSPAKLAEMALEQVDAMLALLDATAGLEIAEALPDGLPPLPDGAVYLGKGGSFNMMDAYSFKGWATEGAGWNFGYRWGGHDAARHYAAATDSAVAKLNGKGGEA